MNITSPYEIKMHCVTQPTLKNVVAKYNEALTGTAPTERCVTEVKGAAGSKSNSPLFIYV
jgi:hypothetical protein